MWLIDLVLALVVLATTGVAIRAVRRQERAVVDLQRAVLRARMWRSEQALFLASRDRLAGIGDSASDTVDLPTAITRFSHDAIAAVPFAVLEAIPATADTTKVVHQIHDEIAHSVYDAISGTTRGIAGLIRRGLTGPPKPPRPGTANEADG